MRTHANHFWSTDLYQDSGLQMQVIFQKFESQAENRSGGTVGDFQGLPHSYVFHLPYPLSHPTLSMFAVLRPHSPVLPVVPEV